MTLADVYILPTKVKGPSQLAVYLAQIAEAENNPVTRAIVVYLEADGSPGTAWSDMPTADLLQLKQYLDIVIDDIFREEWKGVLFDPGRTA